MGNPRPGARPPQPPKLAVRAPDITLGASQQWSLVDTRHVPAADWGAWKTLMAEAHALHLPPEIHCKLPDTQEEDEELVRRGAFRKGLSQSGADQAVATFLATVDAERYTEAEMLGDIAPVRYCVYEAGQVVGAFEWYAINVLTPTLDPTHPRFHMQGSPYPAFQRMGLSLADQMKLTADVVEVFLSRRGIVVGPYQFLPTEVITYTFVDALRDSAGDRECAAWDAEIDARAASPNSQVTVDVSILPSGRQERRIMWAPDEEPPRPDGEGGGGTRHSTPTGGAVGRRLGTGVGSRIPKG